MNYENMSRIDIRGFDTITHKEHTPGAFLQPVDWIHYDEALKTLSSNAFKLWFYLLKWSGKGYYDFSPVNLCKALNIKSKNTIYTIKEELVEKDYLAPSGNNNFIFCPFGNASKIEP